MTYNTLFPKKYPTILRRNILQPKLTAMKKVMFIFALLFIVGQTSFAQDSVYCRIIPSPREAKAIISFHHLGARKTHVKIAQEDGETVFAETIEGKNNYVKIFNFYPLKNGEYVFSYCVDGTERSCLFSKQGETITVKNEHKLQGFYQPVQLRVIEHQALLFVDNEVKKELTVSLLDKEGELIFFDVFKSSEDYRKKLNLQRLSKGIYTLLVQRGDLVYQEDILLE